ncbi:MAG TPA: cyclic nucleotide-binding/CBS domain-containing protein [Gammaproteobacteria bacterium]|nr:cyclic nucleotide-binding/CBS domain-containing protein [Gammaproteobacteria bacterium]
MEIEQLEIRDYLAQCPPLDKLPSFELDALLDAIEISYERQHTEILKPGATNIWLYLVRTGAVQVFSPSGQLYSQIQEGHWFGYRSLLAGGKITQRVKTIEDSLLYQIPATAFLTLLDQYQALRDFFSDRRQDRLKTATSEIRGTVENPPAYRRIKELMNPSPLRIDHQQSIQKTARQISNRSVSSALITQENEICGIVTVTAFCTKVATVAMDYEHPIRDIMTPDPITIDAQQSGSQALLMMARHHIQHLPVTQSGKIIGMVSARDLIRQQSYNALYLVDEILHARSIERLRHLSEQTPATLVALVNNSLTAYDIGHSISTIGESITLRLLGMAEEQLGPPPVPYAWIVAGSLSRNEQTARSDQDNALILSDDYDETEHGQYFHDLSQFVCDGLHQCGYVYCPGDVMASNTKWRQPVSVWRSYFHQWIHRPEPKALMYASIFFDLRCIFGHQALLNTLQQDILKDCQNNTIFLAHMAANALQHPPPLGLFRSFVLEKSGTEEKALNLKKRGVIPITDLARVFALAAGTPELHTRDRLEAACQQGLLSEEGMADLRDALEFIATVRLQHQAQQIEAGQQPDHFVPPELLSSLERRHLKDAFEVVRTLQESMALNFHATQLR